MLDVTVHHDRARLCNDSDVWCDGFDRDYLPYNIELELTRVYSHFTDLQGFPLTSKEYGSIMLSNDFEISQHIRYSLHIFWGITMRSFFYYVRKIFQKN